MKARSFGRCFCNLSLRTLEETGRWFLLEAAQHVKKWKRLMSLDQLDHIAIEVPNIEEYIDKLVATGGLKLLRRGVATATGASIAMLGDRVGMKIELIENSEADAPGFLHIAFRSNDVEQAIANSTASRWSLLRGPSDIAAARARSAFLGDKAGFEFQVLTYGEGSADIETW
jgi:catechol 2,3-dioxygenase-like lactoylglutathione lyase family enzyme